MPQTVNRENHINDPTHEPNVNRIDKPMEFMTPLLTAASVAQSQFGDASGVPSVPIPKTTAVLVILTPKQGVTPQQIMAVIPAEIRATVKLYLDGRIRQWYSRGRGPFAKAFFPSFYRLRGAGGEQAVSNSPGIPFGAL